jgi:hypothetical protein
MKTLKKILLAVGLLLLVLLIVSQLLPSQYHVERSVVIAAKADAIHPWINNLKKWPEWSAWTAAKDPTLVYNYEGPEEGVGAISKWDAKKMGEGSMKLTESDPAKWVKFDLSFDHGKYLSKGTFTFEPAGDGTKVTWGMDGNVSRNPMDRYFSLLMDSMIGKDFEEGLGNLKQKVEAK